MGSVFKKLSTKKLPEGARTFTRDGVLLAEWVARDGKKRSGEVKEKSDGTRTVLVRSSYYFAKYRNAEGIVCTVSTGCRDASAAQAHLARILREEERAREGLITKSERSTAAEQRRPIEEHIKEYGVFLDKTKGSTPRYVRQVAAKLKAVSKDAGFRTLADVTSERLEAWLTSKVGPGFGSSSHASYRATWRAFGNWLVMKRKVLTENPARYLSTSEVPSDEQRERRAITDAELVRLFAAAPEPRSVAYRVMASTGLRAKEATSIIVGDTVLTGEEPYLMLRGRSSKNRKPARVPLPQDVAAVLALSLERRLLGDQDRARRLGLPIPMRLEPSSQLLRVPTLETFTMDLERAGIARVDETGRIVDRHSLRVTFATRLAQAGVGLQHAQKLLRHSDPRLTSSIYTKLEISDLAGAVEKLTPLVRESEAIQAASGGSDGQPESWGAPQGAPAPGAPCRFVSVCDALSSEGRDREMSGSKGEAKTEGDGFPRKKGHSAKVAKGAKSQPTTRPVAPGLPYPRSRASPASDTSKQLAGADMPGRTGGRTTIPGIVEGSGNGERTGATPTMRASQLSKLTPEERAQLAEYLAGGRGAGKR